jgi:hypothetical protein
VTIRTVLPNVGENRLGVASRAGYLFVHAAKRVARGIVIEFGDGANGGPGCARVAIFTGNDEGAVRTTARLPLSIRRPAEGKS